MIKAGALDSARCVDVLDEMFQLLGKGDYIMGGPNHNEHGIKIGFPKEPQFPNMPADGSDRRFMAMVAYLGGQIYSFIDAGKLPPIDQIPSLGDCACGTIKGRESDDDRICLMTSGMPIEDVAWSYDCYLRAKEMGLGTVLKLWDSPHWS